MKLSIKETETFNEKMNQLETIVKKLEMNTLDLDQAMQEFELGLKLIRECSETLEKFNSNVEQLIAEYSEK